MIGFQYVYLRMVSLDFFLGCYEFFDKRLQGIIGYVISVKKEGIGLYRILIYSFVLNFVDFELVLKLLSFNFFSLKVG